MFLRRHRKKVQGVEYDYWTLCESVRTAAGPRQRMIASLGKLTEDGAGPDAGWEDLEALLEGRPVFRHDQDKRAAGLVISSRLEKGQQRDHYHGAYLLRTNCTETDPAVLWRWYVQLTQAEAAFRTAKSDLGMRPIYHQKTARVEAHILVCFLALALWRVLEQWMRGKGLGTCARKLVSEIGTIKSMDVIVPIRRGESTAELTVRTVSHPPRQVAELLTRLQLNLPKRNRILSAPAPM